MNRTRRLLRPLPVIVGVLALAITAWLWVYERDAHDREMQRQFDAGVRQTSARIGERVTAYEQMLRGVRGLFDASDEVTARDFNHYVDALLTGADVAGLRAIAWVASQGDAAAAVTFVAPAADPPWLAVGANLMNDAVTRGALLSARDSGAATLSGRLREADQGASSYLQCMAVYGPGRPRGSVAQRRAQLKGWVCAGFRVGDLMSSLYGEEVPGLAVRLFDGTKIDASTQIHGAPMGDAVPAPRLTAREYLAIGGRSWTLGVNSLPEFERLNDSNARLAVALIGGVMSLALALLTWQLVTARDRALDAARRMTREVDASAERYRRIVDTADEGIWAIDADGRTSFVNPKLVGMLGQDADALVGQPWTATMDEDQRPVADGEVFDALRQGQHVRRELRLRRADGGELWVSLSMSPVFGDDGRRFEGSLAMATDVTDRHRAEGRREQLEAQLRQSQKMEAVGTLAGGIAHDFNNLLAAILGNVGLVQEDLPPDHPLQPRLEQIRLAGTRGRSLVQQIVTFSRQQPQQRRVQTLRPIVEESVRLLRSTLPSLIQIDLRLADEPLWVSADATQLQQVLLNLCTNAWHAMAGRAGRIVVGLEPARLDASKAGCPPGDHARIWVADDGVGMDPDMRARIFEPFFTTKPVGQGTGLGLSVVHGIVVAHGGGITVDSEIGRGSRFDVLLPLTAPIASEELPPPGVAQAVPGQGQHVLYVDDDPLMIVVVDSLLRAVGYRVTTVQDPVEALSVAASADDPVALVVTDFNMPEMSGLELARAVRRARPDLPVIMTSGYFDDALAAEAERAGVAHVLQKEYTLERLIGLVQRALSGT